MKKGRIFVISAPSGSGKTTLCRQLLKRCRDIVISRSATTRRLRKGEKNRRDYIFISEQRFKKYRRLGKLLEWARVFGYFYGTPKDFVDESLKKGKDVLLIIDVQGAFKVKRKRPSAVLIFVMPPSLKELEKRLLKRKSDNHQQIKLRLKVARQEVSYSPRYDYVVVNDDLDRAVTRLKEIILTYRAC
jgi:guanylate kinase